MIEWWNSPLNFEHSAPELWHPLVVNAGIALQNFSGKFGTVKGFLFYSYLRLECIDCSHVSIISSFYTGYLEFHDILWTVRLVWSEGGGRGVWLAIPSSDVWMSSTFFWVFFFFTFAPPYPWTFPLFKTTQTLPGLKYSYKCMSYRNHKRGPSGRN